MQTLLSHHSPTISPPRTPVSRPAGDRLRGLAGSRRSFANYTMAPRCEHSIDAMVHGAGWSEILPGDAYPLADAPNLYSFKWRTGRILPEYQLLLLSGARGEFESAETGLVRFSGTALIYLFPGVWHRFRPLNGTGWTERWVSLGGRAVGNCLKLGGVGPSNAVSAASVGPGLFDGFDRLLRMSRRLGPGSSGTLTPLAMELLRKAIANTTQVDLVAEEIVTPENEPVDDEIVQKALEIIWNNQHSPPLGVADVARMLPVTRRTLDRRFADARGRSVLEEINACRFARAQRLLAETDLPVKAIAYLAGFPSRERMRIMFVEREGAPPSDYRKRVRSADA